MRKIAVYGTLKREYSNHHLLENSKFLGEDFISKFSCYDLGAFPACVYTGNSDDTVGVEIYEVDEETLQMVDMLEGFNHFDKENSLYLQKEIVTRYGCAIMYVYNSPISHREKVIIWREKQWASS